MILIGETWQLRRYGLIVQRELTCIFGHRIRPSGTPFEIAIPCHTADSESGKSSRVDFGRCEARLYVFTTRGKMLWAMDVTTAETLMILHYSMDTEEIVSHFGVGFPVDMKIPRSTEFNAQQKSSSAI